MTEDHAGPGPVPPPRPGIVPLEPLDAGQIVGGALRFVRRVPSSVVAGLLFAVVVLGGLVAQQLVLGTQQPSDPFDPVGSFLENLLPALPFALLLAAVAPLALAAVLPAVTRAIRGRPAGPGAAWAEGGRPRLGALYGVQLVTLAIGLVPVLVAGLAALPLWRAGGIAAAVGLLLVLVVYALQVYVGILLALASPAAVAEGLDARSALWRSVELVRGSWWRCFGTLLLVGLTVGAAAFVAMIPVLLLAVGIGFAVGLPAAFVVGGLGYVLVLGVLFPVAAAGTALLHHDQWHRRGAGTTG